MMDPAWDDRLVGYAIDDEEIEDLEAPAIVAGRVAGGMCPTVTACKVATCQMSCGGTETHPCEGNPTCYIYTETD